MARWSQLVREYGPREPAAWPPGGGVAGDQLLAGVVRRVISAMVLVVGQGGLDRAAGHQAAIAGLRSAVIQSR